MPVDCSKSDWSSWAPPCANRSPGRQSNLALLLRGLAARVLCLLRATGCLLWGFQAIQDTLCNCVSSSWRMPSFQRLPNVLPLCGILHDFGKQPRESIRCCLALDQQTRGSTLFERPGVMELMVVYRSRVRQQHGRNPHRSEFRQGRCPRPANGNRRGTQSQFHSVKIRMNDRPDTGGCVGLSYSFSIDLSCQVKPLPIVATALDLRNRLDHQTIQE